MKTIIITAAFVAIGFIFSRAMYHTGNFFLESIKRRNEEEDRRQ
jgi:hypothetical protein